MAPSTLKNLLIVYALIFLPVIVAPAQEKPYWNEIQNFKREDSLHAPPKNAILFVGSSSFRLWKNVQSSFPGSVIINRGFGGSELPDVIRYADDVIFPYQPKQIVLYCGENDIASTGSAAITFERTQKLIELIRKKLPDVTITYISIKPSPLRKKFFTEMERSNELVKKYLSTLPNTTFVDVYHPMLTASGKPMPQIFSRDSLHMNREGYVIWQKTISPYLMK